MNRLDYCLRDCSAFPCDNFSGGPYPSSRAFLDMQTRRRRQRPPALDQNRKPIESPAEYLGTTCSGEICRRSRTSPSLSRIPAGGLVIPCLAQELWVDVENRWLKLLQDGRLGGRR